MNRLRCAALEPLRNTLANSKFYFFDFAGIAITSELFSQTKDVLPSFKTSLVKLGIRENCVYLQF